MSIIGKIRAWAKKIGPAIQKGGSYGAPTPIGGGSGSIEVVQTGPSASGGSSSGSSMPPVGSGGGSPPPSSYSGGGSSSGSSSSGSSSPTPQKVIVAGPPTKEGVYPTKTVSPGASTSLTQVQNAKANESSSVPTYGTTNNNALTTAPPSTISAYNSGGSIRGYQPSDRSAWEKIKSFAAPFLTVGFYKDVGSEFFGAGGGEIPFTTSTLFSPFKNFDTPKGDVETLIVPYRGTEMTGPDIPPIYKKMTGFEREERAAFLNPDIRKPVNQINIEASRRISTNVTAPYQNRINSGEDYSMVVEDYNKNYEQEFKDKMKNYKILSSTLNTKNKYYNLNDPVLPTSTLAETAVVLAGGGVAPVLTGLYIYGKGATTSVQGVVEKDILKIGLGLGMASLGAYGAFSNVYSDIDNIRVSDAIKNQNRLGTGTRTIDGNKFTDFVKFEGTSSGITAKTDFTGFGAIDDTGKFGYGGVSTTNIAGRTSWTDKPFSYSMVKEFAPNQLGISVATPGKNSFSFIELTSGTSAEVSSTGSMKKIITDIDLFKPFTDVKTETFGGFGRSFNSGGEEYVISRGGKITGATSDYIQGTGWASDFNQINVKIPETSTSVLKIVRPDTGSGITSINFGKSPGTTFAQTFGTDTAPDFSSSLVKTFTPSTGSGATLTSASSIASAGNILNPPKVNFQQVNFGMTGGAVMEPPTQPNSLVLTTPSFNRNTMGIPKLNSINIPKLDTTSFGGSSFTSTIPSINTAISQNVIPKLNTRELSKSKAKQENISPSPIQPSNSFTPSPRESFIPPFGFSLPSPTRSSGIKMKKFKFKTNFKYTPSYRAVVQDIRAKGKAPSDKTKFTGLELRPIYDSPKKKKKIFPFQGFKF